METKSLRHDLLNAAIDALGSLRNAEGVGAAKDAFDSVGALLAVTRVGSLLGRGRRLLSDVCRIQWSTKRIVLN